MASTWSIIPDTLVRDSVGNASRPSEMLQWDDGRPIAGAQHTPGSSHHTRYMDARHIVFGPGASCQVQSSGISECIAHAAKGN